MEKLGSGCKGGDGQSHSSRFRIKIKLRARIKKISVEGEDDQGQPVVKRICEETQDDQEQPPDVKRIYEESQDDQKQQSEESKISDETKDDQEKQKVIEKTGPEDEQKKMGGSLDDEFRKSISVDEAEDKGYRKRAFTLALSKEQIEEDTSELLGSKSCRGRPKKKRSRASQRRLDALFPGVWMESLIDY